MHGPLQWMVPSSTGSTSLEALNRESEISISERRCSRFLSADLQDDNPPDGKVSALLDTGTALGMCTSSAPELTD